MQEGQCLRMDTARYANPAERPSSNLGDCGFDSLPCYLPNRASVGHWQAPLAVNQSSVWTLAVQLRPGALTTRPVRLAAGCETLTLAARVRFPYGSLVTMSLAASTRAIAKWRNPVDARRSERRAREGRGSSSLPLATSMQVRQVPYWPS